MKSGLLGEEVCCLGKILSRKEELLGKMHFLGVKAHHISTNFWGKISSHIGFFIIHPCKDRCYYKCRCY